VHAVQESYTMKAAADVTAPHNIMVSEVRARRAQLERMHGDHETPQKATLVLVPFPDLGKSPLILKSAAGKGRMERAMQRDYPGAKITAKDLKTGDAFPNRTATFPGHPITKAPYGKLADPLIRKALTIADGKIAMLMQSGFLFGGKRALALCGRCKPELIILIPWRVMFIEGRRLRAPDQLADVHACVDRVPGARRTEDQPRDPRRVGLAVS
jgi:hypothetical protein